MVSISRETFDLDLYQGPFFKMVFTVEGCCEDGFHITTLSKEEVEKRFYSILDKASSKIFLQEYSGDTYISIHFFVENYISDEVEYRVYLLVDHKFPKFLRKVADEICSSTDDKILRFTGPYEEWTYSCKEDIRVLLKEDKTQEIKKLNIEVNYWKEAYETLKKKCLGFNSIIEDVENQARWHKENAENQLKNEIKEDTENGH